MIPTDVLGTPLAHLGHSMKRKKKRPYDDVHKTPSQKIMFKLLDSTFKHQSQHVLRSIELR